MKKKNSILKFFIWPVALIAFMFLGAHFWHPKAWPWVAGIGLVIIGGVIIWYQETKGEGSTLLPYVIQFLGLLAFCSLAVAALP